MRASRHSWLVLVSMTGSLSMIMLDQTVVAVALPAMGRELPLSATGQKWVVGAYVLAMAALVALGGRAGDRWGGVTTFRAGVTLFVLASVACGLAPTGELGEPWIIVARAAQGGGSALMVPASAAIVISAFDAGSRGRAMAVYTGISQVFLAIGPLIGGVLTETVSWRAVFWLNVPVGLAALVLVRMARPDNHPRPTATLPAGSAALLVAGIGASVLALQQASRWGWTSPATIVVLLAGLALTAVFVVVQLRAADPLVDVRLFARSDFTGDVVVVALVQFGLLALVLQGSLALQDLCGFGPVAAGAALLTVILPLTLTAQVGGRWYDRGGVRPPVLTGLALAVVGLGTWAAALGSLTYLPQVPGMVLTGLGLGLVASPTNTDALARASATERFQASGIVQSARQLGGTVGVAAIGAVVLGIEREGTRGPGAAAVQATTVGFVAIAAAFLVALLTAVVLLPRGRIAGVAPDDAWRVEPRGTGQQRSPGGHRFGS